jgi:hypothetical protein
MTTALTWTQERKSYGGVEYHAFAADGRLFSAFNLDGWALGVTAPGERRVTSLSHLPTMADAKLAAAVYAAGADPTGHTIRTASDRRNGRVRGTKITVARFVCSCGERQHGSSRSIVDARKYGFEVHWRPLMRSLAAAPVAEA